MKMENLIRVSPVLPIQHLYFTLTTKLAFDEVQRLDKFGNTGNVIGTYSLQIGAQNADNHCPLVIILRK